MADLTTNPNPTFADLRAALSTPATDSISVGTESVEISGPTNTDGGNVESVVTEPVVTEPVTTTDPVTPPVAAEPVDRKPKRFSELTKRAQEAEAKVAELQAKLAAPVTSAVAVAEPVIAPLPGKPVAPNAATFQGTWEELEAARSKYTEDFASWSVQDALNKVEVKKQQAAQNEHLQVVHQTWQQQVDAATEVNENTEAAIKTVGAVVGKLGITDVITESPVGVDIVLKLHSDPEALAKLSKMSIASAAREIGRIEAGIQSKTPVAGKAAVALPDPPVVVGGTPAGDSAAKVKLEDMNMSDFRKYTKANLKPGTVGVSARRGTVS